MYHFILNPMASSGKGMRAWEKVETILKNENIEYATYVLGSAQETTQFVGELTRRRADIAYEESAATSEESVQSAEECHIVVVGGDGTINAVLNGIADFEHTIVSCIRTGSGNDFARNIGVSKDPQKAIQHLLKTPDKLSLDYGEATYMTSKGKQMRRFAISNGVGYDADICEEVSRSRLKKVFNRIKLGKLIYVTIGIKQIFTRVNSSASIVLDDERIKVPELFFVVGMLHEKEGGGVPFCPKADATDGMLEVCLVRGMPKWKLLIAVAMVYLKKHHIFRSITFHRCKELSVHLEQPQWFHIDGETSQKVNALSMVCKSGFRFYK